MRALNYFIVACACALAFVLGSLVTYTRQPPCAVTVAQAETIQAKADTMALELQQRMLEALK
jgi:hypothetical protein